MPIAMGFLFPAFGIAHFLLGNPFWYFDSNRPLAIMMLGFEGIFVLVGVAMTIANVSSIIYYYEKHLIKMTGIQIVGKVSKKHIEDDTWRETNDNGRELVVEEKIYWLEWEYEHPRDGVLTKFEGTADVSERNYGLFNEGESISLRILPNRPEKSYPIFPRRPKGP